MMGDVPRIIISCRFVRIRANSSQFVPNRPQPSTTVHNRPQPSTTRRNTQNHTKTPETHQYPGAHFLGPAVSDNEGSGKEAPPPDAQQHVSTRVAPPKVPGRHGSTYFHMDEIVGVDGTTMIPRSMDVPRPADGSRYRALGCVL